MSEGKDAVAQLAHGFSHVRAVGRQHAAKIEEMEEMIAELGMRVVQLEQQLALTKVVIAPEHAASEQ